MRIIAGRHRGRRLTTPKGDAVRPTTDRVRESLFAIIGALDDTVVVDAYAGSGALGCEALSRGASHAFFFDRSSRSIEAIRRNIQMIDEADRATITAGDFTRSLDVLDRRVDVVFVDPPYGSDEPAAALTALASSDYVQRDCLVVVEQDVRDDRPAHPDFEFDETRTFGDTAISFFYRR